MTASASDIARLRRMISDPRFTLDNDALSEVIERYPLTDERGVEPYWWDTSTEPPTRTTTSGWIPTFDLHAAAADLWEERAASVRAALPDQMADQKRQQQLYDQYMTNVRYHQSRRIAHTITLQPSPARNWRGNTFVGNLAEQDDP